MESGQLEYLTIEAYDSEDFEKGELVGSYKVMINPETYTHSYSIDYSSRQEPGTPNTSAKFEKSPPSEVSFDLVFDGSGIVKKEGKVANLIDEIEDFKKIVYDYNGDIHKPNYLKIAWGKSPPFQCHLTSMSITYKLFRPDGTPIRAEVKVAFKNFEDPNEIENKAKRNSPDLSHIITVVAGDTLPALTYKVYGEKEHYIKVARFNQLTNFRNIKPGTQIVFPPLI